MARVLRGLFMCALVLFSVTARADDSGVERELTALEQAIAHARFDDARRGAGTLLARPELAARERNQALELLAVAQIAARDEAGARQTLRTLYTRDPDHVGRLRDPGPSVSAALARARAERAPPLAVSLSATLVREPDRRTFLLVGLGEGRAAVDSVHLFARTAEDSEVAHVVADVGVREELPLALPLLSPLAHDLHLVLEAHAPSGAVIGRAGSHAAPLRVRVAALRGPCLEPTTPLRRRWWLWTSTAIVIAGLSVGGAIVAH